RRRSSTAGLTPNRFDPNPTGPIRPSTRAPIDCVGAVWSRGSFPGAPVRHPNDSKPFLLVFGGITRPSDAVGFIRAKGVLVLNVAGNRESEKPGIGARVERFMRDVFRRLGHAEAD